MTAIRRDRNGRIAFLLAFLLLVEIRVGLPFAWASPLGALAPRESAVPAGRPAAQESSAVDSPLPVFELHSGFWVNLHHFLYLQGRLMKGDSSLTDTGRGAAPPHLPAASLTGLSAEEIQAWQSAVAFYAEDLAGRDLLLNIDMETINNRLAEMETCPDLSGKSNPACAAGLSSGLIEALERAAPVYRAHWWPEHDRENRKWIAEVTPMIRQMGVELSQRLAEIYQRPWPSEQIRVDVVWYGGPYGAYTSLNPVHVNISSHDPRNQGLYGFEALFHESSHVLAGAVTEAIAREFRQRDKPIPRDLWHALLFYTTGELVRRDLAMQTRTSASPAEMDGARYQPYAAHFGLYSGSWERFRGLLDLYWRPYLDGKVPFETAIARIAAAQ